MIGLLAHGLAVRISREENTAFLQRKVMDNYQQLPQLETYNKVDQKNKEALDLDLNDRSGLKRGTGAPIVIHNRQHEKKKRGRLW